MSKQTSDFGDSLIRTVAKEIELTLKRLTDSLPENLTEASNADFAFKLSQISFEHYMESHNPDELKKALTLLKSSAYEEYPPAQYFLARMYLAGQYVENDISSGYLLLLNSAKNNFPPAQYNLGFLLLTGGMLKKDVGAGKYWLEKAAENQNTSAMNSLGVFYLFGGSDLGKDEIKAIEWLTKASVYQHPKACFLLACHLRDIGHNNEKYINYLTKIAAESDNPEAQYNLARSYNSPDSDDYNPQEANKWFEKAAAKNQTSAQYALAINYLNGVGTSRNLHKTFEYLEMAANANHAKSIQTIGLLYENGIGVEQDINKAVEYYVKAIELNDTVAMVNLALIYIEYTEDENYHNIAQSLLSRAAASGNTQAIEYLTLPSQ